MEHVEENQMKEDVFSKQGSSERKPRNKAGRRAKEKVVGRVEEERKWKQ